MIIMDYNLLKIKQRLINIFDKRNEIIVEVYGRTRIQQNILKKIKETVI
jgi:hypothetical protein